jgi:hypothetical protein
LRGAAEQRREVLRRRAPHVVRDLGQRRVGVGEQPLGEPDPRLIDLGLEARRRPAEIALQAARCT